MKEKSNNSKKNIPVVILSNIIPLAGAIFFAWPVPPILFFYWFDSELAILKMIGLLMSEISKEKGGLFPKKIKGLKRFFYTVIVYLILSIILSIPAFLAGAILYNLLKTHIGEIFQKIFSQKELLAGIGLNIILRGYNIVKNIKEPAQNIIKESAEENYTLLVYRFFAIFFFGNIFSNSSGFGLYIFLFILTIFFIVAETNPKIFLHSISKVPNILKK